MTTYGRSVFICALPVPLMAVSLLLGPSDIAGPLDVFHWIGAHLGLSPPLAASEESLIRTVVWEVRLPRILLAFMVGAALTVSGNSLQALFRNPLVSPDILGLAAGAAFGAALSVSLGYLPLQTTAFCFGLLAVGLSYFLALRRQGVSIVSLILAGVIVSGIFTALLTIVQFLTDPFKLQTIVHWTMGNLHHADWMKVRSSALPILLGLAWLMVIRWRLNVIALGDEETRTAGRNPEREKIAVLLPATLVASASVAVAGIIGLVGLAFPHMVRLWVGPDNRKTQPLSLILGGSLLLFMDDCSRTLATFEIPIGIFTTLIGGPFFIYLLKKSRLSYTES